MSHDRVAVVTGAAGGIGLAVAERLQRDGLLVASSDIAADLLEAAAAEHDPQRTAAFPADLSGAEGAQGLMDAVLSRFGRIDVLVNNAGGGVIRPFLDHDDASIEETLARNLMTCIHCTRAVLPTMQAQQHGRIVNLGAESVRNGLLGHAMYNAAKGGVHGITTGVAREFAPFGITVNAVAPSIVSTPAVDEMIAGNVELPPFAQAILDQAVELIPVGRPADRDEVAAAVAFLAREDASFVTGQVLSVNGGSSML